MATLSRTQAAGPGLERFKLDSEYVGPLACPCNRGHWHSSSSHGTTVLGPGDAGVAVFRQRLRHQSLQQLREPLATRARSNSLSRQPTRPWPVLELKPQDGPDLKKLKFHCARSADAACAASRSKQTLRFYETNLQDAVSVDCELSL